MAPSPYYRIAMITNFFYPRLGGVEHHIWCLSQCLLGLGHKVIVITHDYSPANQRSRRVGVRVMSHGLKVYYLPYSPVVPGSITPINFQSIMPLLRHILLRERIEVVHGHAATSALAFEAMALAKLLGLPSTYTDHSLYDLDDVGGIHLSAATGFVLRTCVQGIICVSHACAENLCLRVGLHPAGCGGGPTVRVLPNAVDGLRFAPRHVPEESSDNSVVVVVLSRLVHRKGIPLLMRAIPVLCATHNNLRFTIGGGGPLLLDIREMIEMHGLQGRVSMLGPVESADVPVVLRSGHIFLNTSLTESFCMAILEASCIGLEVISTSVGGVREVLPENMVRLCEPTAIGVIDAVKWAVERIRRGEGMAPHERHAAVKQMYSWVDIAERTIVVYHATIKRQQDIERHRSKVNPVLERVAWYVNATLPVRVMGMPVPRPMGVFTICYALVVEVMFALWSYLAPADAVDVVPDFCARKSYCRGGRNKNGRMADIYEFGEDPSDQSTSKFSNRECEIVLKTD
mmetsp:Transcript_3458/g.6402  ORF Transcript_3458/g.6402 Transcript_3458/m.6402 type:complete len:515 (-) Transcript_3458:51-1595(-)